MHITLYPNFQVIAGYYKGGGINYQFISQIKDPSVYKSTLPAMVFRVSTLILAKVLGLV